MSSILQTAVQDNATIPTGTTGASLSRLVPLLLSTLFVVCAFLIGLYTNKKGKYLYRRIIVGLILISSILIAYSFGYSYQHYSQMINKTCNAPNNNVYCARHAVQIEAILFSVALACLFLALVFWTMASAFFSKSATASYERTESSQLTICQQSPSPAKESNDELAAWREAAAFDPENDAIWDEKEDLYQNNMYQEAYEDKRFQKGRTFSKQPTLISLPHPAHTSTRHSKSDYQRDARYQTRHKYPKNKESRSNSDVSKASYEQQQQKQQRTLLQLNFAGSGGATKTPTSMSPHPLQWQKDHADDDDDEYLLQRSSTAHVPILNMPPSGIEHPVSKKIIVDKRIRNYLENNTNYS